MNDVENERNTIDEPSSSSPKQDSDVVKKTNKRRWWILVLCLVVIMAVATFVVGSYLFGAPKPTTENQAVGSTKVEPSATRTVIDATISTTEGSTINDAKVTSLGGQDKDGMPIYEFAPHLVSGAAFRTYPRTGVGVAIIVPAAAASERVAAITKIFTDNKLKDSGTSTTSLGFLSLRRDATVVSYSVYESDETTCSLALLAAKAQQDTQLLSVGCAEEISYKQSASSIEPFYEAYKRTASNELGNTSVLSAPEITDGKDGSKKATVYHSKLSGMAQMLLYEKQSHSSDWRFVSSESIQ